MVLVDTNILLRYALQPAILKATHSDFIKRELPNVLISPVSIWEIQMLFDAGRLGVSPSFSIPELIDEMPTWGFVEAPVTWAIADLSRTLAFEHEDPADRFIAATAYHLQCPLLTNDARLRRLPWLDTP